MVCTCASTQGNIISEHPCEMNRMGKDTYLSEGPLGKPQDYLLGFPNYNVRSGWSRFARIVIPK